MIYQDALNIDLAGKTVLIIGQPASGKTTLARDLALRWHRHQVVHTDDHLGTDQVEAMYTIMAQVVAEMEKGQRLIIEGMQGTRLLRKGLQRDCFYPDVVIQLVTTPDRVERTYIRERGGVKKGLTNFNAMQATILKDYLALPNGKPPVWYTVQNNY